MYSTTGVLKEPNLTKEAGAGLLFAAGAYARSDIAGMANSLLALAKSAMSGDDTHEQTKRTKTSPADVVMWTGRKGVHTSWVSYQ
jgi:metacaspase-1